MEAESAVQQRINFIENDYHAAVFNRSWLFSPEKAARSSARLFYFQLALALFCLAALLSLPVLAFIKDVSFWDIWDGSGTIVLFSITCILFTVVNFRERLVQRHRLELIQSVAPENPSQPELSILNNTFFALANRRDWRDTLLTAPVALLAVIAMLLNGLGEKPLLIWRYMVVGMPVILAIVLTRQIRYARRLEENIVAFNARLNRQIV